MPGTTMGAYIPSSCFKTPPIAGPAADATAPAPAFQPLYMGRHYGAAYLALPNPLGFSDTTVILSALSNLSDRSALARLRTFRPPC